MITEEQNDLELMKQQVQEMYTALCGSPIAQDGGMVKRLATVEERVISADKRSRHNALLIKWIIGTGGAILVAIFNFLIKKQ